MLINGKYHGIKHWLYNSTIDERSDFADAWYTGTIIPDDREQADDCAKYAHGCLVVKREILKSRVVSP